MYDIYLDLGATTRNIEQIASAIQGGADINQNEGQALIEAIKAEDLPMVQTLIALGANVNQQQHGLWGIPLAEAAKRGNLEMLTYLLDHGADRYDQAIIAAVSTGQTDILKALKRRGIALQVQSQHMTHCLNLRNEATALYLVQNGQQLTEQQVLTAIYNALHLVIDHLTYRTDYLPSQATYDSLLGSPYEWFLHGIANRELNKTLNRIMLPKHKEPTRKI